MKYDVVLTKEERKLVGKLEKQNDSYRQTLFAGVFCLFGGIIVGLSQIIVHNNYLAMESIFFIYAGVWVIIFGIREKRIYRLIRKPADEKNKEELEKHMGKAKMLTEQEKKLIRFLKKQTDSYKSYLFTGFFALFGGIAIQLSEAILYESYLVIDGIFFIMIGCNIIILNVRYREIYQLIKKLEIG